MSTVRSGGPAFPVGFNDGMSLRDYFAAKAMQSLIICTFESNGDTNYIIDNDGRLSLHLRAYEHADAMLQARGQ